MKDTLCRLLLILGVGARSVWSCECALLPVCACRAADVIFLGRVSFTNHDYSIGIAQATLVRFEVEESFKGVASGVRQIWVDPGSFTSCYEEYKLENRYLIFGTLLPTVPQETAAMTILSNRRSGKTKPLPPGFDPAAPPPIYYSPECAGSRRVTGSSGFKQDLAMLRAYRAGVPMPRVLGYAHLVPFLGWPDLDGPALTGAEITVSNTAMTLKTSTDETGRFSLQEIPAGDYTVRADLTPYRAERGQLHVPEAGCGFTEMQFLTTSAIEGIVLDPQGRGAAKIPVLVRMKENPRLHALFAVTDKHGRFTISGVPDADVYLSAGVDSDFLAGGTNIDLDMRYRSVYYQSGSRSESASPLRLRLGETKRLLVLRLNDPLQWSHVAVKVLDKEGRPEVGAYVNLWGGPPGPGETKTRAHGLGSIGCLSGWKYELEAAMEHPPLDGKREVMVTPRVPLVCGAHNGPVVLVVDHKLRGILAGQIVDANGAFLRYPRVRLHQKSETTRLYEASGDEHGQFRIEDVEPGVYTINITVQGVGEKILTDVGVAPGQINDLGVMAWM